MTIDVLKKYINGYLTLFLPLIIARNFKKDKNIEDACRDYCIYFWRNKDGIIYYIGKGKFINGKWSECRPFIHYKDMLSNTIDETWYCEIPFIGLSEKQAFAAEAYLISICERSRSKRGKYIWDEESLINKKREWKHEELIEEYLILNGNNYWAIIAREINRN